MFTYTRSAIRTAAVLALAIGSACQEPATLVAPQPVPVLSTAKATQANDLATLEWNEVARSMVPAGALRISHDPSAGPAVVTGSRSGAAGESEQAVSTMEVTMAARAGLSDRCSRSRVLEFIFRFPFAATAAAC